jgi:hypothetical protein
VSSAALHVVENTFSCAFESYLRSQISPASLFLPIDFLPRIFPLPASLPAEIPDWGTLPHPSTVKPTSTVSGFYRSAERRCARRKHHDEAGAPRCRSRVPFEHFGTGAGGASGGPSLSGTMSDEFGWTSDCEPPKTSRTPKHRPCILRWE